MMNNLNLEDKWIELENTESASTTGYWRLRINPQASCEIFIAVEKPDNKRVLILEINAKAIQQGAQLPQSIGFEVDIETILPGPSGKIRILLRIKDKRFKDIFAVLVDDIIQHISTRTNEKQAVTAFIKRLNRWQAFLKNYSIDGMSEKQQYGLYGELWFLKEILLRNFNDSGVIQGWVGPCGANQDFQYDKCAVEIKATTGGASEKIKISNSRQLDDTGIDNLILFHISFDVRVGNLHTLPDLVNDIRETLAGENEQLNSYFNDRLIDVGYIDIHQHLYNNKSYSLRNMHFFRVTDNFPRIVEKNLLPGVGDITYSVDLSACLPFQINEHTALACIRGE
jgi:hypothetical protein